MPLDGTETTGHEHVGYYRDEESGLRCLVAIYDTRGGPTVGGTRVLDYRTEGDAPADAPALRCDPCKTGPAGFDLGGGKGVVVADPSEKTDEPLRAYARVVDSYDGRFLTGEDMNPDVSDPDDAGGGRPRRRRG